MGHHMEDQGVQLQKEQMLKKEVIIAKKMWYFKNMIIISIWVISLVLHL